MLVAVHGGQELTSGFFLYGSLPSALTGLAVSALPLPATALTSTGMMDTHRPPQLCVDVLVL